MDSLSLEQYLAFDERYLQIPKSLSGGGIYHSRGKTVPLTGNGFLRVVGGTLFIHNSVSASSLNSDAGKRCLGRPR